MITFVKANIKGVLTMKNKFKINATDVILFLLSGLFLILLYTAFAPCGPKEDGSFMRCQWAWRANVALAYNLLFLSLVHLIANRPEVKLGLSAGIVGIAITGLLIPEKIIGLCMMDTMRCHTHTKGGVYVFSVLILVTVLADIFLSVIKVKKNN